MKIKLDFVSNSSSSSYTVTSIDIGKFTLSQESDGTWWILDKNEFIQYGNDDRGKQLQSEKILEYMLDSIYHSI